jgi:hypothetical protein
MWVIVDPSTRTGDSPASVNSKLDAPHRSGILLKDLGFRGTISATTTYSQHVSDATDPDLHLGLKIKGVNGMKATLPSWALFQSLEPSIDTDLKLRITPKGQVGLDPGGKHDGFPSYGAYSYQLIDGKLKVQPIYEFKQTNIEALEPPMDIQVPQKAPE